MKKISIPQSLCCIPFCFMNIGLTSTYHEMKNKLHPTVIVFVAFRFIS